MADFKNEVGTRQYNVLEKKGYTSYEQATRIFPRKYYDFTKTVPLTIEHDGEMCAYHCRFIKAEKREKNGRFIVKAKVEEVETGKFLFISWFGQDFMYKHLKNNYYAGMDLLVCGKAGYLEKYYNFFMQNPFLFRPYRPGLLKIYTVYPHFGGISDEGMQKIVGTSIMRSAEQDLFPPAILHAYRLPRITDAVYEMHHPTDMKALEKAKNRMLIEDMLYLALKIEVENRKMPSASPYKADSLKLVDSILESLPFQLTKDQEGVLHAILEDMKKGRRVRDLIQGDVGCGKTIVAFLIMAAMAGSGHQSLLFTPTTVLAEQHYKELSAMMEPYGKRVVYLEGGMKASEKKRILKEIEEGEADMVVGTHSILSPSVQFKDLALCVIDEEHKFGVIQRRTVAEKANAGVHTVTMSATPIPRTLSETVFSDNKKVYNILSMPAGRKGITTYISNDEEENNVLLEKELQAGRQAYVVCPLIYDEDTDLMTVEETFERYEERFGKGRVALLHGKMKTEETKETIARFMAGETKILVSTTVVEVGVNNPNASVMLVNNAERFGLAGLHQLRGRIGRGEYPGYCILNTEDTENERLNAMCRCTNGFDIAEEDLRLRGMGNPIGLEQSGFNKLVETALSYPSVFAKMRETAKWMVDHNMADQFVANYETIQNV